MLHGLSVTTLIAFCTLLIQGFVSRGKRLTTSIATVLPPLADAAIALQIAATGGWDANADVNHDSRITSLDALMILQAAAET